MEIGSKLRSLRNARNMTMEELAKMAGISSAYIAMIEAGQRPNVSRKVINKLAKTLRVQPEYFLIDEAKLPMDCLPDLPAELVEMILSAESMSFLQLTKKAMDEGITAEQLSAIIDIFIAGAKKTKKKSTTLRVLDKQNRDHQK